jgi:molybdenum cofactor cytidylyltransferase
MGQPKQLLPLHKKPLIRHCVDTLILSGIWDIAVVLGAQRELTVAALDDLPSNVLKIGFNEDPGSEMAESVRIGMRLIDYSSSGVLVCLCDHPLVSKETLRILVTLHEEDPEKIIIPAYQGRKGHPTLFPVSVMGGIFEGLPLRDIIRKNPDRIRIVEVPDEGVIIDIDTMEDYRKVCGKAIQ